MNVTAASQELLSVLSDHPVRDAAGVIQPFIVWDRALNVYASLWPWLYKRDCRKRMGWGEVLQSFWNKLSTLIPLVDLDCLSEGYEGETIPYDLVNPYEPEECWNWESLAARALYDLGNGEGGGWLLLEEAVGHPIPKPNDPPKGQYPDFKRIQREMRKQRGGAEFLEALNLVTRNTGFPLLDLSYDEWGPSSDEWDAHTVRLAIKNCRRMRTYWMRAEKALAEYDKHPEKLERMLRKFVPIFNRSVRKRGNDESAAG